jgi:golgin subfamily B member 1
MRRAMFPVMIVSLAMAPVALEAQTPWAERGGMGAGMGARGVQAMNPATRVLEHRDALGLNADQVRQLQQLQVQIDSRNQPLLAQIQEVRPAARPGARDEMRRRAAEMTPEQREQMRARMQEQRSQMQQATPEQREQMRARMQEQRSQMQQATPEQREQMRARMQEQRSQMQQATPEQREQMRAEMRERMQAQGGMGPMRQGREVSPELRAQFDALRPVMQQLQENNRQARTEVQAVLTAAQQATLRELQMQQMRRGAEMRQRFQRDGDRPARPSGQHPRGANR